MILDSLWQQLEEESVITVAGDLRKEWIVCSFPHDKILKYTLYTYSNEDG